MASTNLQTHDNRAIQVNVKMSGATPVHCAAPPVDLFKEDGKYRSDFEMIGLLYNLIKPAVTSILDSISHPQKNEILQLLEEEKKARRCVRGLVYYIHSLDGGTPSMIHIHRNYAKTIFKKTVSDGFVFDFNLAIACSVDSSLHMEVSSHRYNHSVDEVVEESPVEISARTISINMVMKDVEPCMINFLPIYF